MCDVCTENKALFSFVDKSLYGIWLDGDITAACSVWDKIPEIQWWNIDKSIQYQCIILKFKYNLCVHTYLGLSAHPAPGPLLPLALLLLLAAAALVITQGLLLAPGRGRLPPPALGTSAIVSWWWYRHNKDDCGSPNVSPEDPEHLTIQRISLTWPLVLSVWQVPEIWFVKCNVRKTRVIKLHKIITIPVSKYCRHSSLSTHPISSCKRITIITTGRYILNSKCGFWNEVDQPSPSNILAKDSHSPYIQFRSDNVSLTFE